MSAFLYAPCGSLHIISPSEEWRRDRLLNRLSLEQKPLCPDNFYFTLNGHTFHISQTETMAICESDVVRVHYRLPGGKGGFGSMLRAIGAQIEKTTSREACRDLSGRRMRDVNNEKKITEWVAKQADKERELARQKQERMERRRSTPKHNFDDQTYTKEIQNNLERIDDALKQGLKASSTSTETASVSKRKSAANNDNDPPKKRKMWLDISTELDDSDEEEQTSPIKASHTSTTQNALESVAPTSTSSYQTDDDPQPSTSQSEPTTSKSYHARTSTENIASEEVRQSENMNDKRSVDDVKSSDKEDTKEVESKVDQKPFNIDDYNTAEELEAIGLDALKEQLIVLGLKCGGTLQERAQRLFSTKGKSLDELDPSLFAKPSKGKKKSKKK